MIRFSKRRRVETSLNVAPLVDIVFLLLIFFLLTSTFMQPGIELTLPEARNSETQESEETVVQITKEGGLYLDAQPVSWEDLKTRLRNRMAAEPERTVIVKADKDVPFGFFVRVMDLSREVGALNLTISTTIPEDSILSPAGESIRP